MDDVHHLRPATPSPAERSLDSDNVGAPQAAIKQRTTRPARTATKRPNK